MRPIGILLLLLSFVSSAQDALDSLEKKALAAPDDSTKIDLLNQIVSSIREDDNGRGMRLAILTKELAQKINYKKGLALALENIGWLYYRKDDYLELLKHSLEAYDINKTIGNKKGMANCLNNIAAVYYQRNQYNEAIKNYNEAFDLAKQAGDPAIMGRSYNNIAFCLLAMNKLDSVEYYCDLAIRFSKAGKDHFRMAFAYRTLGDFYGVKKKYKDALGAYQQELDESSDSFIQASTLHRIGNIYLKLNDLDKAEKYLLQNLAIARKHNYRSELAANYKLLTEVYGRKRDATLTLKFLNEYTLLNDSLAEERSRRQTAMIQTKYEDDQSKAKIELLNRQAELNNKEIAVQRTVIIVFALALLIAGASAVSLVRINRNRKIANLLLKERNVLIDHQKQELVALNATKDKIFSIIGHDLRGPLASLKGLMDLASSAALTKEEFIEISKNIKSNLEYVREDMDNLLSWARTQLKGFDPAPVEIDLKKAVEEKIQLLNESAKSKAITLQSDIEEGTIVLADKDNLDIILRNLMGNAIKFTLPAGTVKISSSYQDDNCFISVSDTGIGLAHDEVEKLFRPESHFSKPGTKKEKGLGIGLLLVKEFVEKNGGAISVRSEQDKGSVFTFSVKSIAHPDKSAKKKMVESINH